MLNDLPVLADYDISPSRGFLPAEVPIERLQSEYYRPWETVIQRIQGLILSKRLREIVDNLPILSTDYLYSNAEWRRAYSILAFISHAYIWGGDVPCERVPPSTSVPFLQTCEQLELPPVATYAGLCLWNWRPIFLEEDVDTLSNLESIHTFTGSLDESWFYLVSVAIEARAAPTIPIMLDAIAAARINDSETVTTCLEAFAARLDELGLLLVRMYENCDPHVFYHRIRPFLAGSSNMSEAGLPNGVMFDTGSGPQSYVHFSGGSNAQSSVIQFFDLVLGVEHRPTGAKPASHGSQTHPGTAPPAPSHNFITQMRKYMPGPHRRFLEHVASVSNIRDYVHAHPSNIPLTTAFDACLAMLRAFRDKHIQMVSRYIIVPSRSSSALTKHIPTGGGTNDPQRKKNLATSSNATGTKKNLRGTGGTALIPFLKQARDETGEGAVDQWARKIIVEKSKQEDAVLGLKEGEGEEVVVGMAGSWVASASEGEGGICHW